MRNSFQNFKQDFDRRKFFSFVGKGFGMMALSSAMVASLFENLQAIANFRIDAFDLEIGNRLIAKHKIFTTPIQHEEFTGIRITPNV